MQIEWMQDLFIISAWHSNTTMPISPYESLLFLPNIMQFHVVCQDHSTVTSHDEMFQWTLSNVMLFAKITVQWHPISHTWLHVYSIVAWRNVSIDFSYSFYPEGISYCLPRSQYSDIPSPIQWYMSTVQWHDEMFFVTMQIEWIQELFITSAWHSNTPMPISPYESLLFL